MVSSPLVSSRRWIAALAVTGCIALLGGCMVGGSGGDSSGSHRSASCGLLSSSSDQTLAAAAMPKRLIRFTATREARTRLTADNAPKLLDEVNSRVDRYDASQS